MRGHVNVPCDAHITVLLGYLVTTAVYYFTNIRQTDKSDKPT